MLTLLILFRLRLILCRGAWRATVHEVTKSQIPLSDWACTHTFYASPKNIGYIAIACIFRTIGVVVLWVKRQITASLWSLTSYLYNSVSNIPSTSLIEPGPAGVRQEPTFCMTASDEKSDYLHNWKDNTELHFSCGSCDFLSKWINIKFPEFNKGNNPLWERINKIEKQWEVIGGMLIFSPFYVWGKHAQNFSSWTALLAVFKWSRITMEREICKYPCHNSS